MERIESVMSAAQERLASASAEVDACVSRRQDERHVACALLAWHQLGHENTESLYRFLETRHQRNDDTADTIMKAKADVLPMARSFISYKGSKYSKGIGSTSFNSADSEMGPVVKLPMQTQIVMRLENATTRNTQTDRKSRSASRKGKDNDTINRIAEACCQETGCIERLKLLETAVAGLRKRASDLAKREAERVELLERAEAAWKDLELGYQKRLMVAAEKDEDLTRQLKQLIDDRNGYKKACSTLAEQLKARSDAAERQRERLTKVEREVCDRACVRLRLSEESAQADALVADYRCKAVQLDRDLQFKEAQARRKVSSLKSEIESTRTLLREAEWALRAELLALREQAGTVAKELQEENKQNDAIKSLVDSLKMEKSGMTEDLDGCVDMCDAGMQGRMNVLKTKREKLFELKQKVIDCRCRLPLDFTVQVKRTPSLAELCQCSPEDKIWQTCSCTSLRSNLMSTLLYDLFRGLQAELGLTESRFPCQFLKCLEDRHNWDRANDVKTNLRTFFSDLLTGELEIAIVTAIENYHAKWVSVSCADMARLTPPPGEAVTEGWQRRMLEQRAQALAEQMAEQMFQDRAEQLARSANNFVDSGPPPCRCKYDQQNEQPAVYSCAVKAPPRPEAGSVARTSAILGIASPVHWRRTHRDVTLLRAQIGDIEKESIKKIDLKKIERKIAKVVKHISDPNNPEIARASKDKKSSTSRNNTKETKSYRSKNTDQTKVNSIKKEQLDERNSKNENKSVNRLKGKIYKRPDQLYAVNLCLCDLQQDSAMIPEKELAIQDIAEGGEKYIKQKPSQDMISQISNADKTKPIPQLRNREIITSKCKKASICHTCPSGNTCFHKKPSSSSIDKLLETLRKWRCGLNTTNTAKKHSKTELDSVRHTNTRSNIVIYVPKSGIKCVKSIEMLELNSIIHDFKPKIKPLRSIQKLELDSVTHDSKPILEPLGCFIKLEPNSAIHGSKSKIEPVRSIENLKPNSVIYDSKSKIEAIRSIKKLNREAAKRCSKYEIESFNSISKGSHNETVISLLHLSSDIDRNDIEVIESKYQLASNTESKYMAAINLDKSNDCSECASMDNEKEQLNLGKNAEDSNFSIKCIKSCHCKKSLPVQNKELKIQIISKKGTKVQGKKCPEALSSYEQSREELQPIGDFQNAEVSSQLHLDQNEITAEIFVNTNANISDHNENIPSFKSHTSNSFDQIQNATHMSESDLITEPSKSFPPGCDYHIQLLGVTLNDMNCTKIRPEFPTQYEKNSAWHYGNQNNIILSVNMDKAVRYKSINSNKLRRKIDDNVYKNKSIDAQSFKKSKEEDQYYCVCCNRESSDLEINTFHLIEEHLKERLEEFKRNCCSACILPDQEQQLYSKTLQNIKKIITDSICGNACKCSEEPQTVGSWNRANSLLQEYLKIKIQRVHCKCETPINSKETFLPEMINKVCNMIDNDFQRIKDLCKCENGKLETKDIDLNKQNVFQLSEKDSNGKNSNLKLHKSTVDGINNHHIEKLTKKNSNTSMILTQDISCQVSPISKTETKSCGGVQKCDTSLQTVDTQIKVVKKCRFSPEYENYEVEISTSLEKKQINTVNKTQKNAISQESSGFDLAKQDVKRKGFPNLPYIGYTVDCSCDRSLGQCVCTKSIIQAQDVKVNTNWHNFTNNTGYKSNISYIMDNVYKKQVHSNFSDVF